MVNEEEKPKKARLSQPQVRLTTPDESLQRYHVELFNPASGKAKDALFEEINFDLYKPGAKSFAVTTSEGRIALWIRCFIERYYKQLNLNTEGFRMTWEEQESASNASMCDRIIVHLYNSDHEKQQHMVAITIYVSTGTIFVQGKYFQQYGLTEFPLLLDIVNRMQELGNTADVTNVDSDLYTSTLLSSLQQISCPTSDMTIDLEDREESEGGDDEIVIVIVM